MLCCWCEQCVLLLATLMSKKVDVRLPAVAARQKLDRHAQLEILRGANLLPGKIPLGFVRISSAKSKNIVEPHEIQRQLAVSGKDSEAHGGSPAAAPNLPFTAGDMCAQLNVLSSNLPVRLPGCCSGIKYQRKKRLSAFGTNETLSI